MLTFPVFAWIEDTELGRIEWRIEQIKKRLFHLDEEQLFNRIEWTNWGIGLLQGDKIKSAKFLLYLSPSAQKDAINHFSLT